MPMQHDEKPLREVDSTAGSAAEDRFEEILEKLKAAGAEIINDTSSPLYVDLGREEVEIGEQRVIELNLNATDFEITRNVKDIRVVKEGQNKSLQDLSRPIIEIKLRSKPEISDQWVIMDMEDLF